MTNEFGEKLDDEFGDNGVNNGVNNGGYHKEKIAKGELGQISKIQEELDELKDAETQNVKILMLCELADIVGAVKLYLNAKFPGWTISDLSDMANLTEKAFQAGQR